MKKIYTFLVIVSLFTAGISNSAYACYATFNHTNACAGDTVWFYGLDTYAVHAWDFGDTIPGNPNTAYSDSAFHVYTNPGTYYVTHFVNIGAEWAFETQVITIGTDCFAAAFNALCGGGNYFNFTNLSVGSNLMYSWNFGDPLSAPDNTSALTNPQHNFTAPGNYIVTLVIDDGNQTDTAYQTVTVTASCMSAYISYMLNTCFGDTTFFYYNFTNVTSVSWDFGDPLSGPDNYSTSFTPWHIFTGPGVYTGSVTYSNAVDTVTTVVYTYVVDCNVWPGDVNRDGIVSAEDILAIGMHYGSTGTARPNASTNFNSQPAPDWNTGNISVDMMYLSDMVNTKNADCNGDGVINASDVQAVTQNLGMTHFQHNNLSSMQFVHPYQPHLLVDAPVQMTSGMGSSVSLKLGDAMVSAQGIYGFCTTIQYDNTAITGSSVNVDFTNSWLDTVGQPHLLNWFYNDAANGLLTIVSVRTDLNNVTGYGEVANISFNVASGYSGNINFNLGGDTKIMSNTVMNSPGYGYVQNFINANLDNATVSVVLGMNEHILPDWLTVYPSPATDFIHVSLQKETKASVALYDMAGRLVVKEIFSQKNNLLSVSNLSPGIYHLGIEVENRIYNVKVMVK
jgi:PKD repeat protein